MKTLQSQTLGLKFALTVGFLLLPQTACESKKGGKGGGGPAPATGTATDTAVTPPSPSTTACLKLQSDDAPPEEANVPNEDPEDPAKIATDTATGTPGTSQCPAPSTASDSSPNTDGEGNGSQNGSTGTGTSSPGSTGTTPAPSPGTGTPGTTYSTWTPGPGISSCYDQGKVWVAVSSSAPGKSGTCGESLANYCCTQSDVIAKFPRYKSSLEPKFADYSGKGFTLYGCSTDGNRKTTFHFVNAPQAGSVSYATFWIEETSQAGVPPASCPRVTLESLGIGTGNGTTPPAGAGSTSGTGGSTSGVPASSDTGTGSYGP